MFLGTSVLFVAVEALFFDTVPGMLKVRRVLSFVAVLVFFGGICRAERGFTWRVYKATDGLAESFVTAVSVSSRTNVWTKHRDINLVSSFNGYKIKTTAAPPAPGYNHIYESRGGQVWAVSTDGLQELKNGVWVRYPVKEIREEFQTNVLRRARSISLVPVRHGHVLFLLSDRLMEFNNEWPPQPEVRTIRTATNTMIGRFSDMALSPDGSVWIAGENGLIKFSTEVRSPDGLFAQEFVPPPNLRLQNFLRVVPDADGLTVLAQNIDTEKKAIVRFDGVNWTILPVGPHNIRQAWRAFDGSFWAITINSLLHLESGSDHFVREEIGASEFYDAAVERSGIFWLATSQGLFRCAPLAWIAPTAAHAAEPVRGIAADAEGRVWAAFSDGLTMFDNATSRSFPFPDPMETTVLSGQFFSPVRNKAFVLEAGERMLRFRPQIGRFDYVEHRSKALLRPLGQLAQGELCVELRNPHYLELFDGDNFRPAPFDVPPIANESEILFAFASAGGDVWLSTTEGLLAWRDNKWVTLPSDGSVPTLALCMVDIGGGKLWCGTRDGIWEYDGKTWIVIRSGLDRVNAMAVGRDGRIWVATNSGLLRHDKQTWLLNTIDEGLASAAVTSICEDRRGHIWVGTTRGVTLYQPSSDLDPPRAMVMARSTADDGTTTMTFGGMDKWNFTSPDQLVFSYRIDSEDWSDFQPNRSVSFPELAPGKHYFQVRAMDRNGNIQADPGLLEFELPVPWYRETRLVLIGTASIGAAIFFAGLAFNRHRRLLRSYAEVERIVELRTKQLKEANTQLLHSQKMTALGTLSAGVAHDFNNILSIIRGSAQIIESNLNDSEKVRTRVERIKTVVEQGTGIVRAMLGFSRTSEEQLTLCDANVLVSDTIKLLGDRFVRGIDVVFQPSKNLPSVCASKNFVQQILLNIIFNAADAMNGSGKVILRTRLTTEVPKSSVMFPAAAPAYVSISVQDFGCGIASDFMGRIFEPFFTTKAFSSRRGTGLGLSMAYEMASNMKCGLAVESELGKGSTFSLLIPVPDAENPATEDRTK